jgi:glycosyltransferase involved in cell wall biosynthesis
MGVENPVASLPMKMTTVVSMELTGNCPVSDADILIRYQPKNAKQENEYKKEMKAYQQQLFMGEIFPVVVMQQRNKFERSQLGLPEDKFIVAVVGNRLDMEIDEEFADVLTRILMQNTKIDIVIIGEVHGIKEFFKYEEIFEQRIHCIGYCNELMETYGVMDLYLNPKRTGGGWSSVMAMSAGLPVVTLPECDVAYNVGEEFVVNSYEEVVDTVLRYAGDKQFYKNKRLAALELAKRNDEEKWEAYIKKMLDNIVILTAETVRI